jgi:ABC-type polysaccharide/polyol phosphate transport system ATPase subunit
VDGAEPYVRFDRVWKKFQRGEVHNSLRDLIPAMTARVVKGRSSGELRSREFWALQDVSFEIRPGEALGIIGRNGAGKSTVLKTLTRILRPNRGECFVRGRIGAVIEVSAGFHADLTGRENIFLQGAIMGMPPALTREKFDEIVEFSGIGDFLETPVKRYSSGMNARLGFAIAAHLDPDVLIIDEVLSVGDYAFQRRAFDRIAELARSGIPVVVVSHQLDRIAELCTKAIVLDRGRVVAEGTATECISTYVLGQSTSPGPSDDQSPVRIDSVESSAADSIESGNRVELRLTGNILRPPETPVYLAGVRVRALSTGQQVFSCDSTNLRVPMPEQGPFTVGLELQLNVPPGKYLVETAAWDPRHHRDAFTGPTLLLTVSEGRPFSGAVQMNPRMWLIEPSSGNGDHPGQ